MHGTHRWRFACLCRWTQWTCPPCVLRKADCGAAVHRMLKWGWNSLCTGREPVFAKITGVGKAFFHFLAHSSALGVQRDSRFSWLQKIAARFVQYRAFLSGSRTFPAFGATYREHINLHIMVNVGVLTKSCHMTISNRYGISNGFGSHICLSKVR